VLRLPRGVRQDDSRREKVGFPEADCCKGRQFVYNKVEKAKHISEFVIYRDSVGILLALAK